VQDFKALSIACQTDEKDVPEKPGDKKKTHEKVCRQRMLRLIKTTRPDQRRNPILLQHLHHQKNTKRKPPNRNEAHGQIGMWSGKRQDPTPTCRASIMDQRPGNLL
jgi:hypothetical protein